MSVGRFGQICACATLCVFVCDRADNPRTPRQGVGGD